MSTITLHRILLFLKSSEREAWEGDRLRQRGGVFCSEEERKRHTGQFSRYPLREQDLFRHDCFRFIDRAGNTIGDVYVFFNLHDGEKKEKLFISPNEHSGGIDFAWNNPSIVDCLIPGKIFQRWVPLPGQFLEKPDNSDKTYVVIHHPQDACRIISGGTRKVETMQFSDDSPPIELEPNLFLTGGSIRWCKKMFSGEDGTLGLKSFFQFIEAHESGKNFP